jgi:hypothetical protein
MRWYCVLLTAGVALSSSWWGTREANGQTTSNVSEPLITPTTEVRVTPVTMTAVRPLELEGAHTSPVPEPSAAFVMGLLGSAFLIRRRRTLTPHV